MLSRELHFNQEIYANRLFHTLNQSAMDFRRLIADWVFVILTTAGANTPLVLTDISTVITPIFHS